MKTVLVSPADLSGFGGNLRSLFGVTRAIERIQNTKPDLLSIQKEPYKIHKKIEKEFNSIGILKRKRFGWVPHINGSWNSLLFSSYESILNEESEFLISQSQILVCFHLMSLAALPADLVSKKRIIVFTEVLESSIWDGLSNGKSITGLVRKIVSKDAIKADEISTVKRANAVFTYSEIEKIALTKYTNTVRYIPFPLNIGDETYELESKNESGPGELKIGFIGNLAWPPNLQSLRLLFAWIKSYKGSFKIHIFVAGAMSDKIEVPEHIRDVVTVLGKVPDVASIYQKTDFMWCDVPTNGGVRVKIVEALCFGRIPICERPSLEGIPYKYHLHSISPNQLIKSCPSELRKRQNDLHGDIKEIRALFSSDSLTKELNDILT
jgi:hypothetical protein